MLSAFIMTVFSCVWSENGRTCGYSFSVDGHNKCVAHRPCVYGEFIYNPLDCDFCSTNIDFLSSMEVIDRSCMQLFALKIHGLPYVERHVGSKLLLYGMI